MAHLLASAIWLDQVSRRQGCEDLLVAVEHIQPLLHIFGHIHEDGGLWQRDDICFANVTCREGCRMATVVELDLEVGIFPVDVPPA